MDRDTIIDELREAASHVDVAASLLDMPGTSMLMRIATRALHDEARSLSTRILHMIIVQEGKRGKENG